MDSFNGNEETPARQDERAILLRGYLAHVAQGIYLFPVTDQGIPRTEHGFKDATTDPDRICAWYEQFPRTRMGIDLARSGLTALDLDVGHKDGADGLSTWRKITAGQTIPKMRTEQTPRGGQHLYVKGVCASHNPFPGIEVRSIGQYVVAAPSPGYSLLVDLPFAALPTYDDLPLRLRARLIAPARPSGWTRAEPAECKALHTLVETTRLAPLLCADTRCRCHQGPSAGGELRLHCPLHHNAKPALTLTIRDERILAHCQSARCAQGAIWRALYDLGIWWPIPEDILPHPGPYRADALPQEPAPAPAGHRAARSPAHRDLPTPSTERDQTGLGNARRFVRDHGSDLIYVEAFDSKNATGWFVWDGCRFAPCGVGEPLRRAFATIEALYHDAWPAGARQADRVAAKWALSSATMDQATAMLRAGRAMRPIDNDPGALDRDLWLLNCQNGTLDLRTGTLYPHQRNDKITKMIAYIYDPRARSRLWMRFLIRATGGDRRLLRYLQRAVGMSLVGEAHDVLFFVHGPAASGKTTFTEAVLSALGDYATPTDFDAWLWRRDRGVPNDMARLKGVRLTVSTEADKHRFVDVARVKRATGGETLLGRFLFGETFTYTPQFTLWWASNNAPKADDMDGGLWRRLRVIPFDHPLPEDRQDDRVRTALRSDPAHLTAILTWAVRGCLAWQRKGLGDAPAVRKATQAYRDEQDPLRDFFAERCRFGPDLTVAQRTLHDAYLEWVAKHPKEELVTSKDWGKRLRARGITDDVQKRDRKATRLWKGITLRDSLFDDDADPLEEEIPPVTSVTSSYVKNGNLTRKGLEETNLYAKRENDVTDVTDPPEERLPSSPPAPAAGEFELDLYAEEPKKTYDKTLAELERETARAVSTSGPFRCLKCGREGITAEAAAPLESGGFMHKECWGTLARVPS